MVPLKKPRLDAPVLDGARSPQEAKAGWRQCPQRQGTMWGRVTRKRITVGKGDNERLDGARPPQGTMASDCESISRAPLPHKATILTPPLLPTRADYYPLCLPFHACVRVCIVLVMGGGYLGGY